MKKLGVCLVLLTANAFATKGGGNGGDVVVCPNKEIVTLDSHQGRESWNFHSKSLSGTREEIIKEALRKFQLIDSFIAKKLLKRALLLNSELEKIEANGNYKSRYVTLTNKKLLNVADEGIAEIPSECEIKQAATQNNDVLFPGEVKFTFQKDIWERMDSLAQTSLVIHEVIYEHLISVNENSSRSARYMNAALFSGNLDTLSDYLDISASLNYKNLEFQQDGFLHLGSSQKCHAYEGNYWQGQQGFVSRAWADRRGPIHTNNRIETFNQFYTSTVSTGICEL